MPAGRPKKPFDIVQLDKLLALHCTQAECAEFFDLDPKSIATKVMEETGQKYSVYSKRKMQSGKMNLRRAMFTNAIAKNNSTIQIWLSKQHLNMSENPVDPDLCEGLEFDYEWDKDA